jgi:hypothetical protein
MCNEFTMRVKIKICAGRFEQEIDTSGLRGLTLKFANSPQGAFRGSSGQKPQYGLMTLAYQRFTAVLLLIYCGLFLSDVYYCLRVFWYAVVGANIKFLVKLGKSGSELRDMSVQVYGDTAIKRTAVYTWMTRFSEGRESVTDEEKS